VVKSRQPLNLAKDEWKFFTGKNADYYKLSAADFEAKWKSPGKTA